jgi:hypothetical protein
VAESSDLPAAQATFETNLTQSDARVKCTLLISKFGCLWCLSCRNMCFGKLPSFSGFIVMLLISAASNCSGAPVGCSAGPGDLPLLRDSQLRAL